MGEPEIQVEPEEQQKAPPKEKEVIATKVTGTVKWFNVKSGYGFINRHDTKEDVFVHQSAIIKNNPRKYVRSVGDGEEVEFDVVVGEKGNEAANVTGPEGEAVRGSPYAADRRRGYRRGYYRRGAPIGGDGVPELSGSQELVDYGVRGGGRGGRVGAFRGRGAPRRFYRGGYGRGRGGGGGGRGVGRGVGGPLGYEEEPFEMLPPGRGRGRGRPRGRGGRGPRGYFRRTLYGPQSDEMMIGGGVPPPPPGNMIPGGRRPRRPRRGRGAGRGRTSEGDTPNENNQEESPPSGEQPPVESAPAEEKEWL